MQATSTSTSTAETTTKKEGKELAKCGTKIMFNDFHLLNYDFQVCKALRFFTVSCGIIEAKEIRSPC